MELTRLTTDTFEFLKTAAAPNVGKPLSVDSAKTLIVEIYGTVTSKTVAFEQQGPSGAWYPIMGIKTTLATPESAVTTSATGGEIWAFDISAVVAIRMNLTAVVGGSVNAVGKVILL